VCVCVQNEGVSSEMNAICEQICVRMGANPSMAPRARVPVEVHQGELQQVFTYIHVCACVCIYIHIKI
jgi:hypothetical protein